MHGYVAVRLALSFKRSTLKLVTFPPFRWMFDCSRVPGLDGSDWSVSAAKETDDGIIGHIVVFRHNQPWMIETSSEGRLLSVSELEK